VAEKITFLGGSTSTLKAEFSERLKYKTLVDFPGMIDTLYNNFSYGLINKNYEPVYLIDDPDVMISIGDIASDVRCLGFVAKAFNAFRNDYTTRIENTTRGYPPFLDGVVPVLGYEPLEPLYGDYLTYVSIKYSSLLQNDRTVNDYRCYLIALKQLLKTHINAFPVTRSGFILSRHNNIRTSGLSVELSNLDYNSDFEKGEIIQSPNFQCFLDYASSNGFFVDKYSPWRLHANLEHPTIKTRIRKAGAALDENAAPYDVEKIMDSIYRLKSHDDDLYDLQDFVIKTYNDIKKQVPFFTEIRYNNRSSSTEISNVFRPEIEMLSSEEWLSLLLMVRMMELGKYSDEAFRQNEEIVLQNYRIYGIKQATGKIGQISAEIIKSIYESRRENNPST
jgi:hypothetical protein